MLGAAAVRPCPGRSRPVDRPPPTPVPVRRVREPAPAPRSGRAGGGPAAAGAARRPTPDQRPPMAGTPTRPTGWRRATLPRRPRRSRRRRRRRNRRSPRTARRRCHRARRSGRRTPVVPGPAVPRSPCVRQCGPPQPTAGRPAVHAAERSRSTRSALRRRCRAGKWRVAWPRPGHRAGRPRPAVPAADPGPGAGRAPGCTGPSSPAAHLTAQPAIWPARYRLARRPVAPGPT